MLRTSGFWLVVLLLVFVVFNAAFAKGADQTRTGTKAGCAGCAQAGGGGCAGCAQAKAGDPPAKPQVLSNSEGTCPGCGMQGGICQGCLGRERELLSNMARSMCSDCTPEALCQKCLATVEEALAQLPTLAAATVDAPPIRMAYLAGTVSGGIPQLIMDAIAEVAKQNLFGQETYVGCLYPDMMANGFNADTPVFAGVNISSETEVKAPLQVYEIPAGTFLKVDHYGPYNQLKAAWWVAFAYADLHGLELREGPSGEVYVSDPETTPMEKLLTEIYIPLAKDAAAPAAPAAPAV